MSREFQCDPGEIVGDVTLFFGDFVGTSKQYDEITDRKKASVCSYIRAITGIIHGEGSRPSQRTSRSNRRGRLFFPFEYDTEIDNESICSSVRCV